MSRCPATHEGMRCTLELAHQGAHRAHKEEVTWPQGGVPGAATLRAAQEAGETLTGTNCSAYSETKDYKR